MVEPSRPPRIHVLAASLLCLSACGDPAPPPEGDAASAAAAGSGAARPDSGSSFPLRFEDDAGRTVRLEEPPARIVSLVPSTTRIMQALGEGERLVGRTDYDLDPALAALPSVGGGLEPSLERLLALEPDFVFRFHAEADRATPRSLDAAEIPHAAVRPDRIDDVRRILGLVAEIVGRPEAGDSLRSVMDGELEAAAREVRGRPPPRVAFLLGGDPPWVVGGRTFLDELLGFAGAENVFGDEGEMYAPMSLEEVIRRGPDLILAPEGVAIPSVLGDLPVIRVPPEIQSPGPDLGRSARLLAELLHGASRP